METHLRTLQKKRTANFREDETKLLIQLWGSPAIQNKLFLTHRKAPVMRLLAANMQQRGFYRTPDEIKTRIRNLKCLYHRIKRTMSCGTGIGTVDPDWPHFKAMDEILSKEYPRKVTERLFDEPPSVKSPKLEVHVKQEIDDIDIDDTDSWATTNESINSEFEDESHHSVSPVNVNLPKPVLGSIQVKKTSSLQAPLAPPSTSAGTHLPRSASLNLPSKVQSTIVPTIQIPTAGQAAPNQKGAIPFPLLILNNLNANKNPQNRASNTTVNHQSSETIASLLKDLLMVQKENLSVIKEKLQIEKQRLEFDRMIGTQMVTLIPMLGGLLQRLGYKSTKQNLVDLKLDVEGSKKRKRTDSEESEMVKDSKILRSMLEQGIRKYMIIDENDEPEEIEVDVDVDVDKEEDVEKSDDELHVDEMGGEEKAPNTRPSTPEGLTTPNDDDDDDDQPLVIDSRRCSPRVYRTPDPARRSY